MPEVGKFYHFWDDGKVSPSRHYIARLEGILTRDDAIKLLLPRLSGGEDLLYNIWEREKAEHDIFSRTTEYFLEVSCPTYDDNLLYFAQTRAGGWFSFDIQNYWQGGFLDITGKIFERAIKDNPELISSYMSATYTKR